MIKERVFRDPIHDLISLNRDEREDQVLIQVIDSAEVQRLRRIKQLGMAHMAFPGADHARFQHCLGVMHLARRIVNRLGRGENELQPRTKLIVQAAALLHDIGHGPFSHVIENFFEAHHETWSKRLITDPRTEVNAALQSYDEELAEEVAGLLDGKAASPWISSVISSQLDADRFDYLLRDSHMTGVKYGVFDLERLILLLRISDDKEHIVVHSKGLLPVEKYLQSRYQMYRQVYFHKTVTSAEAMLMAALDRARDMAKAGQLPCIAPESPLARVLRGDSESLDVPDYLALDDSILLSALNAWSRCGDSALADISSRLLNRRLFKSLEMHSEEDDLVAQSRLERAREYLADLGADPDYYLRLSTSADTPYKPYSPGGGMKSTIWIQDQDQPEVLHDVKDISPTIKAFTESPYAIHRVFFPEAVSGRYVRQELSDILRGE